MSEPVRTPPFAPFEWMLSTRYLRARRKEGFISVIAGFSFLGIMLGVATLIIVMAVMNGFRKELLDKILGLNGHIVVQPLESPLTDWKDVAERISKADGIRLAAPVVDGQGLGSSPFNAAGVFIRGIRAQDLNAVTSIAKNIKQGTLDGFDEGQGVAIGRRSGGGIDFELINRNAEGKEYRIEAAMALQDAQIGMDFQITDLSTGGVTTAQVPFTQ